MYIVKVHDYVFFTFKKDAGLNRKYFENVGPLANVFYYYHIYRQ